MQSTALPVAVFDIGSTAVRLVIAQPDRHGKGIQILESLQQEVSLGKDTFTRGYLSRSAIEECAKALGSFRTLLRQYDIVSDDRVRAIATSAVREATNRDVFLDRVLVATGIRIDAIDDAQVNRYTYLGVLPHLTSSSLLKDRDVAVMEVGGGATSVLLIQNHDLTFSQSYRLGAFRLRESLERSGVSEKDVLRAMESQISRTVADIRHRLGSKRFRLLVLGGDVRFAASQIMPGWDRARVARLSVSALRDFINEIIDMPMDALVRAYHLSYPDAETLVPALLTCVRLAQTLGIREFLVTSVTMRDGILSEMILSNVWFKHVRGQIVRSAIELGAKFDFDRNHAEHIAALCGRLFTDLKELHMLEPQFELTLTVAAILHEVGLFISNRSHHKHSMYIILNSGLFGLGAHETLLVALVARYHRKALPLPVHEGYATLDRDNRIAVQKMAALLRIADALDRSYTQRVKTFLVTIESERVILDVSGMPDVALEQVAVKDKAQLFEQVFGRQVLVRPAVAKDIS